MTTRGRRGDEVEAGDVPVGIDTAELADDAMDDVSGGLPNESMTTQNGQGIDYTGIF